jgi:DNA-binding NtrC family response regulator
MELRNSIERRLLGKSQAIEEIKEQIQKIAPTDLPVLITGETGVGKTLAAELIHELSPRASREFIHLNCSNISPELFESELFGHERGAFTGAVERKKGKLEVADGGTVFFDEIGDLSLQNQAKLLHFMENGTFYRVGGTEKVKAEVKLVAATNKNLSYEVKNGRFRLDLYYRISAIKIHIPPLRERKEDIPILVESILKRESDRLAVSKSLLPEALDKLLSYHWPGNVRELENVLKRAMVFCDDQKIKAKDIIFDAPVVIEAKNENHLEKKYLTEEKINEALTQFQGNKSRAAQALGISRVWLYKILKKYEILNCKKS